MFAFSLTSGSQASEHGLALRESEVQMVADKLTWEAWKAGVEV